MADVMQGLLNAGWQVGSVVIKDGDVDLNGAGGIIFDADADTKFEANGDNVVEMSVAGAVDFILQTNELEAQTGSAFTGAGLNVASMNPQLDIQAISGPGAITITEFSTEITTTGADAFTMVDGAIRGQRKRVTLIVDGGDATLAPTNLLTFTNVTFSEVGDWAEFEFDGSNWVLVAKGSVIGDGATPVAA